MGARRYGISLRVLNSIAHVCVCVGAWVRVCACVCVCVCERIKEDASRMLKNRCWAVFSNKDIGHYIKPINDL